MSRAPGSSELAEAELIEHFRRARRDPDLAVLEGFHALKQALRFGAEIVQFAVTSSKRRTGTGPPSSRRTLRSPAAGEASAPTSMPSVTS